MQVNEASVNANPNDENQKRQKIPVHLMHTKMRTALPTLLPLPIRFSL